MWAWGHPLHTQEIPASKSAKAGKGAAPTMGPQRNLIHGPSVLQSPGTWGDGPREPVGPPCSRVIPALMQSRQLDHNTPHPGDRSTAGSPSSWVFQLPALPAGGETEASLCLGASEGSGTCFAISEHVHLPQQVRKHAGSPSVCRNAPRERRQPRPPDRCWEGPRLRTTRVPVIQKTGGQLP